MKWCPGRDDENEQRRIRLIPRMRSSTVLILSLKTVAHEIIKNLVLAGIGRLIVMDNGTVTEEDLGSGFLFREEEGAVGQEVGLLPFCDLSHRLPSLISSSRVWRFPVQSRKGLTNSELQQQHLKYNP